MLVQIANAKCYGDGNDDNGNGDTEFDVAPRTEQKTKIINTDDICAICIAILMPNWKMHAEVDGAPRDQHTFCTLLNYAVALLQTISAQI